MKVCLLSNTPDPIKVIYLACRTCYSKLAPSEMQEVTDEKMVSLIKNTILSGHHSVLEHASFSFSVEGVSRALTHQLVRHRLASYAQQSQRYVEYKEDTLDFVMPKTIAKNYKDKFDALMKEIFKTYRELVEDGVPAEDARYLLPNASTTNIIVTMNFRELMQFSKIRLCYRAQWEILEMVKKMKDEVTTVSQFLANGLQPKCQHLGYCDETKPCGCYKFSTSALEVKSERNKLWDM